MRRQFRYLRQIYIQRNYIRSREEVDYASLLIDEHYDLLSADQARSLRQKNSYMRLDRDEGFNDEEHFFLNRIGYYLFKQRGEELSFKLFVDKVETLQNGSFEKKCMLLVYLLDENENMKISRQELLKFFLTVYIKDLTGRKTPGDIANLIFESSEILPLKDVIDIFKNNMEVKDFVSAILQV